MDPDEMLHHVAQEVAAGELLESCPAVLMDWGHGGTLDIEKDLVTEGELNDFH